MVKCKCLPHDWQESVLFVQVLQLYKHEKMTMLFSTYRFPLLSIPNPLESNTLVPASQEPTVKSTEKPEYIISISEFQVLICLPPQMPLPSQSGWKYRPKRILKTLTTILWGKYFLHVSTKL